MVFDLVKGFKNFFIGKSNNSNLNKEGVIFFDSTGRVIGNGQEGFRQLTSGGKIPSFYEIEIDAFGRSPWVYIIVDRIAKSAMKVNLQLLSSITEEPISPQMNRNQRVIELKQLLKNPQQQFTRYSFQDLIYSTCANYLLNGNGYMLGFPYNTEENVRYTDIINPLTSYVSPNDDGKAGIDFYTINYFNLTFDPKPKDVMFMGLPNLTQYLYQGYAPMQALGNIWKANNALNINEQLTHERQGSNGILYSEGQRIARPKELRNQQEQIDNLLSNYDRSGRYTYLSQKVGFIDLSKSFKDLQNKDTKNSQRETIAAAYNYPVTLLNDTTSSTFNNNATAEKTAYEKAVLPVLDLFLKEFNKWLVMGNYNLKTVYLGYKRETIPELNLVNKEKTENNSLRIDIIKKVQEALQQGSTNLESAINMLVIAGGFTQAEAEKLLVEPVNNNVV